MVSRTWIRLIVLAAAVAAMAAPVRAEDVEVAIGGGRVTILAHDATVKEILTEWGRVGGTAMIDIEKLTDETVTLELVDVPEAAALRTLLRSAAGYMAAPRAATAQGASRFDRILIMATSKPAARVSPQAAARTPSEPAQRLGIAPNVPRGGRTPVAVTPVQQEQLDQLQALLQGSRDDGDEPEREPEPEPVFGNLPTSLPGQVMSSPGEQTPQSLPTGVFGSTSSEPTAAPVPTR